MTANQQSLRLHVNAVGAVMGGAARHLSPFLAALNRVRPDWSIRVWVTRGYEPTNISAPLSVRAVPRFGVVRRLWWESVELPMALRSDNADALLNLTNSGPLHSPVPSILYQRNPLWFDPDWVRTFRGRARLTAVARRQLAYLQMRASSVTVVPSEAMADFLLHWHGAPAAPSVDVIPHAVDLGRFSPSPRTWPPPPSRPIRLLSVSHAAPHKDQVLLVRLVALLRERGLHAQLALTVERGDSPEYFDEIHRERQRLAVEDRVELVGRIADVERLYREADVMILASRSESFGFPIIEAMASGIPVVASGIQSSKELLGRAGWFFRPGDLESAASTVQRLLATPGQQVESITAQAARTARAYSWSTNATRIASAIETALGPRRQVRARVGASRTARSRHAE